jgi:predicted phosphate transport protein (TIGR00153 family)
VKIQLASLLRGRDRDLFELFTRAGANIHRSAELLAEMLGNFPDSLHLAGEIRDCEHEGDHITHELIERMNKTFVTPIEREDVLQLASALDDVVDYTEEVADFLGLYRIEAPMAQAERLAGILCQATGELAQALPMLQGFKEIRPHVLEIHRLENEGDAIVREAITSLFQPGIDPIAVIRWKDIFERLEQAIDSTERAAYILEGILIKNA